MSKPQSMFKWYDKQIRVKGPIGIDHVALYEIILVLIWGSCVKVLFSKKWNPVWMQQC